MKNILEEALAEILVKVSGNLLGENIRETPGDIPLSMLGTIREKHEEEILHDFRGARGRNSGILEDSQGEISKINAKILKNADYSKGASEDDGFLKKSMRKNLWLSYNSRIHPRSSGICHILSKSLACRNHMPNLEAHLVLPDLTYLPNNRPEEFPTS